MLRMATAEFLRDSGFQVVEAASGDEAVAILSAKTAVDFVFSDVDMPGNTDGLALAAWLAENHHDIPVLLTSGAMNRAYSLRGAVAGLTILPKPYRYLDVEKRIRAALADKKS